VIAWSRKQYAARLFLAAAALMLVAAVAGAVNAWPSTFAQLPTALPLPLQLGAAIGIGLVALTITASLVGLAIGALPHRLTGSAGLPDREALQLGAAAGFLGAAVLGGVSAMVTPAWSHAPYVAPLGTVVPIFEVAIDPITSYLTRAAIILSFLASISIATSGWNRRRALGAAAIAVVGFFAAGAPPGSHLGGWFIAGLATGAALLATYVTLLRADLTMIPIALGVMMGVSALARSVSQPFPGALAGAVLAVIVIAALSWWSFGALRRWRARAMAAG
jgi:hypothetical protein